MNHISDLKCKCEYKTCFKVNQVFWIISLSGYRNRIRMFKRVLFCITLSSYGRKKLEPLPAMLLCYLSCLSLHCDTASFSFAFRLSKQNSLVNQTKWLKKRNQLKWIWRPVNQGTTKAGKRSQVNEMETQILPTYVHIHNTFSLPRGHVLMLRKEPCMSLCRHKGLYSSTACNLIDKTFHVNTLALNNILYLLVLSYNKMFITCLI